MEDLDKYVGKFAQAGGELKRVEGVIVSYEREEPFVWFNLMTPNGNISKWSIHELTFIPAPKRKETYDEKVEHFQRLTNWDKDICDKFITLVYQYLDSCGYFEHDYNIHGLMNKEFEKFVVKYRDKDFGSWLLDFALQYNMEQGMEYECKFKGDRQDG